MEIRICAFYICFDITNASCAAPPQNNTPTKQRFSYFSASTFYKQLYRYVKAKLLT